MAPLDEHKVQRILSRFPWRRRRPRVGPSGAPPIALHTQDGEQLWADSDELAEFSDPGPALLCIALHADLAGRLLVRSLVAHHARAQGINLPGGGPDMTRVGVQLLDGLLGTAGLDPAAAVGPHGLGDLVTATWAIAAGDCTLPA